MEPGSAARTSRKRLSWISASAASPPVAVSDAARTPISLSADSHMSRAVANQGASRRGCAGGLPGTSALRPLRDLREVSEVLSLGRLGFLECLGAHVPVAVVAL